MKIIATLTQTRSRTFAYRLNRRGGKNDQRRQAVVIVSTVGMGGSLATIQLWQTIVLPLQYVQVATKLTTTAICALQSAEVEPNRLKRVRKSVKR